MTEATTPITAGKLHGKVTIVTGDASGIGQEVVRRERERDGGVCKHAAPAMVEGGRGGSVICTASFVASTAGSTESTDYTMSKHAVLGLVRSASLQSGSHGVRVNSMSPGSVGPPMLKSGLGIEKEEEVDKVVERFSRLKGVLRAKNVADAVVFLASDNSEFVTGHDLVVDGGFVNPLIG